jgi:hypothetical protein
VPLAELAHVEADHGGLVVEEAIGERLGQLGLADAGGTQEQEGSDRPAGIAHAGAAAAHGPRHGGDRVVLPDHAGVQIDLEVASRSRSLSETRLTGMPVARAITAAISRSSTTAVSRRGPAGRAASIRACTAAISSRMREASS